MLHIDGVAFDDLPEFKEVGEVPEVGSSIIETHEGANTHRVDLLVFIKGRRNPVSIEHNLRSGSVTLDICGKPKESWQAKSFAEAFSVPYNFTHEDHKFTLKMKEDDENDEEILELEIDGVLFKDHPYVDKDFGKSYSKPSSKRSF